MKYTQLTSEERYMVAQLKWQGFSQSHIAQILGRHRSTICRELKRNATTHDGIYRVAKAVQYTKARRSRSRRNQKFTGEQMKMVIDLMKKQFSPDQARAVLGRDGLLKICNETIYAYIRRDRRQGGTLHKLLRLSGKLKRKRNNKPDSRGRLKDKRSIHDRPAGAEKRSRIGHWEIDTVMGVYGTKPCILTLVDRKTGYVVIGKLKDRTVASTNRRLLKLMGPLSDRFKTITADNGTEFHRYKAIEKATNVPFYFADPYHSWQRGSNENTNGLIRQYLPKGTSMETLTQRRRDEIAEKLNHRPRQRYGYRTPAELFLSC